MTLQEFLDSIEQDSAPPHALSPEAKALWHAKKGNWDEAHDIAQDIHTRMGSWIHALLHLIEGDVGNANYWYHKAQQPPKKRTDIDAEWRAIAGEVLSV